MSGGVEIIDVSEVSLPPLPHPPPSSVKLTFFDAVWVCLPPVQRLSLYSNSSSVPETSFSAIVDRLKSSLSSTLVDFLPLAGKLTYLPSTGDVEIDCSEPGYGFVVAESDMDLHRLITDEVHDVESFRKLVPAIDTSELPFRLFSVQVQVTRFKCGGAAIGFAAHHAVGDGKALWQFIEAWTRTCRAEMKGKPRTQYPIPSHDRPAIIGHPKGEELKRKFLHIAAPNLPRINSATLGGMNSGIETIRRTFVLSASNIRSLKRRANKEGARPPSTFLAISVHLWSCFVRARSFKPEECATVCIATDCRSRLNPPLEEGYFGNCVRTTYANVVVGDLTAEDRLARVCEEIESSIMRMSEDPLWDVDNWYTDFGNLPFGRVTIVTGSPRFEIYGTDFGFGRPDRVELVSMNRDGEVTLAAGKEEGTVQVTVELNRDQMDTYAKAFVGDLRHQS